MELYIIGCLTELPDGRTAFHQIDTTFSQDGVICYRDFQDAMKEVRRIGQNRPQRYAIAKVITEAKVEVRIETFGEAPFGGELKREQPDD